MNRAGISSTRFVRIARILGVCALVSATSHAEPASYNPYGRFSDYNPSPIPNDPRTEAMARSSGAGGLVDQIATATQAELQKAEDGIKYCVGTIDTPEKHAACRLAASRVQDPVGDAARVNVRSEVIGTAGDQYTGKADLGRKLGEATRVALEGAAMLREQQHTVELAAWGLLNGDQKARVGFAENIMSEASRNYLRYEVIQSTRIKAVHLLTAEWDVMKNEIQAFNITASINEKGTRQLADDEDPTDPGLANRYGPVLNNADLAVAQTAPVSNKPPSFDPGPAKFGKYVPAAGPQSEPPPPGGVVALGNVRPERLEAPERLQPGSLEPAQQLAYDVLKAQGLDPAQLLSAQEITAGTMGRPGELGRPGDLQAGALRRPDDLNAPGQLAPAPPGRTPAPRSPAFDREQAEEAADRYLAIVNRKPPPPEPEEGPAVAEPAPTPALFARASDVYRQFPPRTRVR